MPASKVQTLESYDNQGRKVLTFLGNALAVQLALETWFEEGWMLVSESAIYNNTCKHTHKREASCSLYRPADWQKRKAERQHRRRGN